MPFTSTIWNYLRVRGEYSTTPRSWTAVPELPPRARRIHKELNTGLNRLGTTSACAENTAAGCMTTLDTTNYLRVRGEYSTRSTPTPARPELPPRARRIPLQLGFNTGCGGTTSACAENTFQGLPQLYQTWNYLRVRGEYTIVLIGCWSAMELPPRARRIPPGVVMDGIEGGTTSACAENTTILPRTNVRNRNYLRVRGEYSRGFTAFTQSGELPPRARRIRAFRNLNLLQGGTTSACAENTRIRHHHVHGAWNYLRVRGEYR
ncbi:Uncharacterised protein [Corynebacterium matruchotii]|nr:Uncharacterised protein [Corynebacterium matruchotii]